MSEPPRILWRELLFVLLVTAAGLALRVYRLDEIPYGLHDDEAAYGLDAVAVLQGERALFFERNNGREPLFVYLEAATISGLGATPFALRLTAALVGVLTLPVVYGLTRALFARSALPVRPMAAWALLFFAFSYWHLCFSRLGFRAITLPLVMGLAILFWARAWHRLTPPSATPPPWPWRDLILCGLFVGLTQYTYTASRFAPLLVMLALVAGLCCLQPRLPLRRGLLAAALIGSVALVTAAPIGLYFFNNWASFVDRAGDVSIFASRYAPQGPWRALLDSLTKTALMFVTWPDPNLRHNPAARPILDPLLALWLAVGVVVCVRRWRKFPYILLLLWTVVMALPVVLTAEGLPHSLRSIGMLIPTTLSPVVGMVWLGQRLPGRLARWAIWLPLPFFLLSAGINVQSYFRAWDDPARFRSAFLAPYAQAAQEIAAHSSPDHLWVLPQSSNYVVEDTFPSLFTMQFLIGDRAGYSPILVDEANAPGQLQALTAQRHFVHVLHLEGTEELAKAAFVFDDIKNLLDFLLRKHGRLVPPEEGLAIGLPYSSYAVRPGTDYRVGTQFVSETVDFAGQVHLRAWGYGQTAPSLDAPPGSLNDRSAPAGHALWAVLRWEAAVPIDHDLKVSMLLKDDAGHVVGQVDKLLVGDRYPVFRVWEANETASTYHILDIMPAIPPGAYHLFVKVYEEESGRIYAPQTATEQRLGVEFGLGELAITPGEVDVTLTSEHPLPEHPQLAPDLALLGFDLPRPSIAPGETLPLTLIWRTADPPTQDYIAEVQLTGERGAPVASARRAPGNESYPTTQWRAGEVIQNWHDLPLPPDTPHGDYSLVVRLLAGGREVGRLPLAQVTVQGRARQFTPPPLAQPVNATFDEAVQLLGVDAPAVINSAPGDTLTMTLGWQAQRTPATALVRFVHLLGEGGAPVAQQDTVPCNGECPAVSWLAGEVLIDPVALALPAGLAPGAYRLVVGWYDPATFVRPAAVDGRGERLADDVATLPVTVTVTAE